MSWKKMIRATDVVKLIENYNEQLPLKGTKMERDYFPVAKLFNPAGSGTWLITEANEDGLAFGVADLGYPEMGYVDLNELAEVRLMNGHVRIEQDLSFISTQTLSQYVVEARRIGYLKA